MPDLSYRSSMSGRALASNADARRFSALLADGAPPPLPSAAAALCRLPAPQSGAFTIAGCRAGAGASAEPPPPALVPLASLRATRAVVVAGAGAGYAPGGAAARASAAASAADAASAVGAATAGSHAPAAGPAARDPDGISAAVGTLRRFRRLLEAEQARDPRAPPLFAPPQPPALAAEVGGEAGGEVDGDAGGEVGGGGAVAGGAPLLGGAPASLATSLAASSSGSSVVGTLRVGRDALLRATLAAAKWARIVKTSYGASSVDPVEFVVELQRTFHAAFLDDMHTATGGDFAFTAEPAPTTLVANVGALNMLLRAGRSDFAAHLLPPHASNRRTRFTVVAGTPDARIAAGQADNGTIAAAGAAAAAADAAAAAARGPPPPRAALTDVEAGASSTALIVRPPPSSTKLPPPLPQPPPHARADAETRMLARYEAALAYKGEAVMSKCT